METEYCCYCGRVIKFPLIRTSEHLVPVSKGGNNKPENKRPCCHHCNSWRGNKSLRAFYQDVLLEKKENKKLGKYTDQDLEIMLYNIDWINDYISSAGNKLIRK